MSLATGYQRNPNRRALPAFGTQHHRLGAAGVPSSVDLARFSPPIFDQGQTGSCVGHARARGIATARMYAQHPLTFVPSPKEIYGLARCFERNEWSMPLVDAGCDPVDSIDAVMTFGVGPMLSLRDRYSDCDPATINEVPTLGALETAAGFTLLNDHQVASFGAQRLTDVCAALASGYPVCIDVAGGAAQFQNYTRGVLHADGQPLDHYVCLMGYRVENGATVFEGHNSWGLDWGVAGTFDADESVIQAAGDLIVCVEVSP